MCRDLCRTNPLAPLHAPAHRAAPRHQQISCLAANWIFYFLSKPIDICHHHKTRCSNGQRWTIYGSVSVQSRDIRCNCKSGPNSQEAVQNVHDKFPNPAAAAHALGILGHFAHIVDQECMILLPFHVIFRGQTFIILSVLPISAEGKQD